MMVREIWATTRRCTERLSFTVVIANRKGGVYDGP